ncbi:MAG: patatin-like phospholipase family protein [Spirochaetaceae bacterium]|jgi:NTE family protein|nr:patatin-like phospholipase family protein [Spirochaetaceae bacterium]
MKINSNLKWALVLSGGGAKGFAHIGILNAFSSLGFPPPSLVAGTSMGAIVGGLYACGMESAELTRFALEEFNLKKYLDGFAYKIDGPLGKVVQTGQILGNLAARPGMDSGERILELLETLSGGKTFEETRIPFRCNAVDIADGREVALSSGSVARAIRASMSFPVFFEPLREGDRFLVDGGLANNLPVYLAREAGYKKILAVDVGDFNVRSVESLRTGMEVLFRVFDVTLHVLKQKEQKASFTIHAGGMGTPFSFSRAAAIIQYGERIVREHEEAIRAFFSSGPGAFFTLRRRRECGVQEKEKPVGPSGSPY